MRLSPPTPINRTYVINSGHVEYKKYRRRCNGIKVGGMYSWKSFENIYGEYIYTTWYKF